MRRVVGGTTGTVRASHVYRYCSRPADVIFIHFTPVFRHPSSVSSFYLVKEQNCFKPISCYFLFYLLFFFYCCLYSLSFSNIAYHSCIQQCTLHSFALSLTIAVTSLIDPYSSLSSYCTSCTLKYIFHLPRRSIDIIL